MKRIMLLIMILFVTQLMFSATQNVAQNNTSINIENVDNVPIAVLPQTNIVFNKNGFQSILFCKPMVVNQISMHSDTRESVKLAFTNNIDIKKQRLFRTVSPNKILRL